MQINPYLLWQTKKSTYLYKAERLEPGLVWAFPLTSDSGDASKGHDLAPMLWYVPGYLVASSGLQVKGTHKVDSKEHGL